MTRRLVPTTAVPPPIRWLAVTLCVALTAGACAGSSGPTPEVVGSSNSESAPTDTPAPAPGAADPESMAVWQSVLDRIEDDGSVDLQTAIDAFSLTVRPLPGSSVTAPAEGFEIDSATGPVVWLSRHLDQLSAEQRSIVADALRPAGVPAVPVRSGFGESLRVIEPPADEPYIGCFGEEPLFRDMSEAGPYREVLNGAIVELSHYLGHLESIPIIGFTDEEIVPNAKAVSLPFHTDCSKPAAWCTILLTAKGRALTGKALQSILVHELVHCYQGTVAPIEQMQSMPPWVMEGYANWAAEVVVEGSGRPEAAMHWRGYLEHPEASLFGRSYDAIGFFAHMDETGIDPWPLFTNLVKASDSEQAWTIALEQDPERFLSSWPTGFARDPERGMAWDVQGPGVPNGFAVVPSSQLANDGHLVVSVGPVADALHDIAVTADVVTVAPGPGAIGRIGFDDLTESSLAELTGVGLCTLPGGCECPEGETAELDLALRALPGEAMLVALTGGLQAATVEVFGVSMDTICEPAPVDPCLVGSWSSEPFVVPSPIDPALTSSGGSGVRLIVEASGAMSLDFSAMSPLVMHDSQVGLVLSQLSAGRATSMITAEDGLVTVFDGQYDTVTGRMWADSYGMTLYDDAMPLGPAAFVMQRTGSYSCGEGTFTYTTSVDIEPTPIAVSVPFTRV